MMKVKSSKDAACLRLSDFIIFLLLGLLKSLLRDSLMRTTRMGDKKYLTSKPSGQDPPKSLRAPATSGTPTPPVALPHSNSLLRSAESIATQSPGSRKRRPCPSALQWQRRSECHRRS